MRDYPKLSPKFWTGRTGKEICRLGLPAQVTELYLLTSPHGCNFPNPRRRNAKSATYC